MKRLTIENMHQLAESRGGTFLSFRYTNSSSRHEWQCEKGHRWQATPSSITQGSWCPHCAGLAKKTYADMVALAESRGGKFLSPNYISQQAKHRWECEEGHQWTTTPNSIHNGTWCPECSRSRSERFVRLHFERLFQEQFPSCRPKWLISPRGKRMELDGYCRKLRLAFEYHGMQHFTFKKRYHRNEGDLAQRQIDDQHKRECCDAHGVYLIEVPYHVPIEQLHEYIVDECKRLNVRLPTNPPKSTLQIKDAYVRRILEELASYAGAKGGRCLAKGYKNSLERLEWECAKGHRWRAIPQSIRRGHWCPACKGKKKRTIEEMYELAASRGGKCLSLRYTNAKTPLLWECKKKHQWWTVYSSVQKGSWCRNCAGLEKKTIEEMRVLARAKGGECLSTRYTNIDSPLQWKCEKGHMWFVSPWNIKKDRGTWCPVCAGNTKKTIEEMHELARIKGGFCRSTEYINARKRLVWECKRGHRWAAAPGHILKGAWCKKCPRKTVEDMQEMARSREGYCLSTDYLGRYAPLTWKCASGHIFSATPNAIRQRGWCNECKNRHGKKLSKK